MTPTSETGAVKGRGGFTLVELMATIAVIGLAASAVMLTAADPRPGVADEAEVLAARLMRAREEALLVNRPLAVEVEATGHEVEAFDGVAWAPVGGAFKPVRWDAETSVDTGPTRILFDPTGLAEPVEVRLRRDGRTAVVAVDDAGEVRVK